MRKEIVVTLTIVGMAAFVAFNAMAGLKSEGMSFL
jgi:hypothetical protein